MGSSALSTAESPVPLAVRKTWKMTFSRLSLKKKDIPEDSVEELWEEVGRLLPARCVI
jgi:hypothetical protein